ncbi:hypothetical protein CEXT_331291, partial [Caerostris extrusa]
GHWGVSWNSFTVKTTSKRVARLRVAKGEIIRPIQRIYPLELSSP